MSAAIDRGPASFWQPIEDAAHSLASASSQTLPAALTLVVDLLAGDLIPRLRAEEKVLLPLAPSGLEPGQSNGLSCAEVSRLTDTLSTLGARSAAPDIARVHDAASVLLAVLETQRKAEAALVARILALPVAGRGAGSLSARLEEEAQAARAGQFFVFEADRLPTEAWVLRHNPKAVRIGRLASGRTSPVADLAAVLEPAV